MGGERKPDPEALQAVAGALESISKTVEAMAKDAGVQLIGLAKTARANRRMIWALVVSVAVDILLSAGTVGALVIANRNAERIDAITHRLDVSQSTTRKQALCPLYSVLLDSQSAAGRERAPDPMKYDNAFKVIREGYNALGCAEFISKPSGPVGSTPSSTP